MRYALYEDPRTHYFALLALPSRLATTLCAVLEEFATRRAMPPLAAAA